MSDSTLSRTAALFLALGDSTRLRLLNLMCEREVCVSSFTTVLGQSQPLVSRHLAYLRNAGVVDARREGKWIHYSIAADLDDNTRRLMNELFNWMDEQPTLSEERIRYYDSLDLPAAAVKRESRNVRSEPAKRRRALSPIEDNESVAVENHESYDLFVDADRISEHPPVHHNELEDFLL